MERVLLFRRIFLALGSVLGLVGALLLGASILFNDNPAGLADANADDASDCAPDSDCGPVRYAVDASPAATVTVTPRLDPAPAAPRSTESGPAAGPATVQAPTPLTPGPTPTALRRLLVPPTPGPATPTPGAVEEMVAAGSYTSTAQVHARLDTPAAAGDECPSTSAAGFDLIPVLAPPTDHPDAAHGDLNVALRGYQLVSESLGLVKFEGPTAPDPPQLSGLFLPNRGPVIKTAYRVNDWIWDAGQCHGQVHGCPGRLIDDWQVTMIGLAARPGELLSIPERGADIYPGGYKALVLYAGERQLTLSYTRRDAVSDGYAVHLQGLCVDPNLVALYRAQNDANGWRAGGLLPALRNDQPIGLTLGDEIKVAIRDKGSFMDPRSGKDWWRGY
ncbi:MAG: hypothetical protein AB1801_09500 [Chloroflexota bacterium]